MKIPANPNGPLINIPVGPEERILTWLVDSGAGENVIDETTYRDYYNSVELQDIPSDLIFKTADGSPLRIVGYCVLGFKFGCLSRRAKVYVCKGVTRTRLLGNSLLSTFSKWGVDNREAVFCADNETVPLVFTTGSPPKVCSVTINEEFKVPPMHSCLVKGVLPHYYDQSEFLFRPEPNISDKCGVFIPVCLVANDLFDGTVTIKVTNLSAETKTIAKGLKLGEVKTGLDKYTIQSDRNTEGNWICNIQQTHKNSTAEMLQQLKTSHPELYDLYTNSCQFLNAHEKIRLLQLLFKYQEVFSVDDDDIGTTTAIKHKIIPKSDKVVYRRQYRHTEEQNKLIDIEVEKLLKNGVIKESMSPYNNPVLLVPKSEPGKWRFCLDCRYVNDLTEDQYFPIPRIDDAMDCLSGSTIFSVVDCTSGYHQVPLEEEASEMCAFSTRKGHWQYTKMPMGLRGSGMTFQKLITLLMAGMLHAEVLAYLDDCILFSKSIDHHLRILEEVLSRFSAAKMKLKPRKCKLFQEEIVYLGHLVNSKGIRPNPKATKLIKDLPSPTDVQGVQRFLGKINYYRKFIPKLAEIAHPLYELTKCKGKDKFCWDEEHQEAFDTLKSILCSQQVLGSPRFDRQFILDVDASDYALGAELSQVDDMGNERPLYFASRHLEKAEKNYSATARETLAAVFGCEYFSHYLQGRKFLLRTDHNPLVWLRSMKNPKRPYNGWIVRLEQFHYEIQYRPGKNHENADFNSRVNPVTPEPKSIGTQTEWKNQFEIKHIQNGQSYFTKGEEREPDHVAGNAMSGNIAQVSNGKNENPEICDNEPRNNQTRQEDENLDNQMHQEDCLFSTELLTKQQEMDIDIGPVIKCLKDPKNSGKITLTTKGQRLWRLKPSLSMLNGVLIKEHRFGAGHDPIKQIVLPSCMKNMVLECMHDNMLAGHFGTKRTLARIQLRYYWPGYLSDVEEWCRTCLVCQKRKDPPSKNVAPMQSICTGEGPFEQLALDILKLPRTQRGNQYLLVIQDYFSKWVEAFPLVKTAAPSVAQCLINGWIARFGCPHSILSDQGTEFESNLFRSLNKMLQVKKLRTTPYHPRTDGMVERCNRTVIDVLSKYADIEPDWDLRLPLVLFALRTSEHASTKFSPFRLIYGKEAKLPWDIVYGTPTNQPLPQEEWVTNRHKDMQRVFKLVQEHTQRAQLHQKRYYDKNLKGDFQIFEPGNLVMMCDPAAWARRINGNIQGKLNNPWSGPFEIIERLSDSLYKIKKGNKEIIVNTERLKKYYHRNEGYDQTQSISEDSSDEEDNDMLLPNANNDEIGVNQEAPPAPPAPIPGWGENGELRCNLDQANIVQGPRARTQTN